MSDQPSSSRQLSSCFSPSGFDMLGVLIRVATRPNPVVNIGNVDMSCPFVVCDALAEDYPIVYCSEYFERLTGYPLDEILGRNCRFLQAPYGELEKRRIGPTIEEVKHLKVMIQAKQEVQVPLVNYRKDGKPFMNLVTVIPIEWEQGKGVRYFVGFQADVSNPGIG
ncbi:hypothetical protein K402DRAFT_324970 [Aulographum hederae CBS 113979]|uniref:PAS domain-containing protein n=1 Tax=Aulographum hederae CBS 113979 TaxID=1176131 RepID=A0A6G1HBA3_9PEZI|nr:hypothetical protein K402DRAFT_324970 [Aulographum hederae CBS 113979]